MHRTGSAPHCLIVEDEVLVGMDLEDGLREAGFEVRWVASAASALAILATTRPDVVVLDVMVRAMPCIQLLRDLKRRGISFVVHTAYPARDMPDDIGDAPRLGKPAEMPALLAAVDAVLPRRPEPAADDGRLGP